MCAERLVIAAGGTPHRLPHLTPLRFQALLRGWIPSPPPARWIRMMWTSCQLPWVPLDLLPSVGNLELLQLGLHACPHLRHGLIVVLFCQNCEPSFVAHACIGKHHDNDADELVTRERDPTSGGRASSLIQKTWNRHDQKLLHHPHRCLNSVLDRAPTQRRENWSRPPTE